MYLDATKISGSLMKKEDVSAAMNKFAITTLLVVDMGRELYLVTIITRTGTVMVS